MKHLAKIFVMLTFLLTIAATPAFSQNNFYLKDINIQPGTSTEIEFCLDNTKNFYGFQADIELPTGLNVNLKNGSPDVSLSSDRTGNSYQIVSNLKNGVLHVAAFSKDKNAISGNSGVLLKIAVTASSNFTGGDVKTTNVKFVDQSDSDNNFGGTTTLIKVLPAAIHLYPNNLRLYTGYNDFDTEEIQISYSPDHTNTVRNVRWDSSNPSTAQVDKKDTNGENNSVTGTIKGNVTITATSINPIDNTPGVTATCNVDVEDPEIGLNLSKDNIIIENGTSEDIKALLILDGAPVQNEIKWSSSDNSIITLSQDNDYKDITGQSNIYARIQNVIIQSVSPGDATITAEYVDRGTTYRKTCEVQVIISPTQINIKEVPHLHVNYTQPLDVSVIPENYTPRQTLKYASSDESIVSVDENGIITAKSLGQVVITASCPLYTGGEVTGYVTIEVIPVPATNIEIKDESGNNVQSIDMFRGTEANLKAIVYPYETTDQTVIWTSSNPDIADVDDDGKITTYAVGTTEIVATCGDVSAKCTVNVLEINISLNPLSMWLGIGEIQHIEATVTPESAKDKPLTWTSDNTDVATVDSEGNVTAISIGDAAIIASCGETQAMCYVSVASINPNGITIDRKELSLGIGETGTLIATVTPENASDKTVVWTSSDPSVAQVSSDGVVTAIAEGTVTITASTVNGLTDTCTVTIHSEIIDAVSISLSQSELLMREGYTAELIAIITPVETTDKTVTWSSSDPTVATVDNNGIVTAIKQGVAIITASTANDKEAYCKVTVVPVIIAVEGIEVSPTKLNLKEGSTYTLIANIIPESATDGSLTWKSSNKDIVTVSETGVVTAISVGTAMVYVSSSNGLTAACTVTVEPAIIPVDAISLSNTKLLMREGYSTELIAIVHPDNATDKRVTWASDNEEIATVDDNGKVTANTAIVNSHLKGQAIISATSVFNPKIKAECVVTVDKEENINAVTDISLNEQEISMFVGEIFHLIATITPEDATDKTVTWKSSDRSIAIVSEEGVVTALSEGTAIIYASSPNGLTVECRVTVSRKEIPVESISLSNIELLMRKGHTAELLAIVRPIDATDQRVIWTSSDESIVTVDQNGIVTAVEVGKADVIVTSVYNPYIKMVCVVTVVNEGDIIPVTEILLNKYELDMMEGDTFPLIATILPEDATDKSVTWKSSDRAIATCTDGVVSAISEGTAIIYASSSNGLTVECVVNVSAIVPVEEISLSSKELLMREGRTAELYAIIRPDNATDKEVVWSSSSPENAIVDQNGVVTAILQGNAIISATSANGVSGVCYVTVVPDITAVESIELNEYEIFLYEGETFPLIATITPEDATDKCVTWISSDRTVAIASQEGVVTAIKKGTSSVLASSSNGLTAECIVNVYYANRPKTPKMLLRKGDGTSSTFVTLIDYSDEEIVSQGIKFGFGYDTPEGESRLIGNTPLRYCHTTEEIFNDSFLDFWVFSYYLNEAGEVVNSDLRYLDGREEICYDASKYLNNTKGEEESEDWIIVTPYALYITPGESASSRVEIFTIEGAKIFSNTYDGASSRGDCQEIDLKKFTPGVYLVVGTRDGKILSKRIIVR